MSRRLTEFAPNQEDEEWLVDKRLRTAVVYILPGKYHRVLSRAYYNSEDIEATYKTTIRSSNDNNKKPILLVAGKEARPDQRRFWLSHSSYPGKIEYFNDRNDLSLTF